MKKLIIVFVCIIFLFIIGFILFKRSIPDLNEKWEIRELGGGVEKGNIYLKRATRGLNYSCIVLSTTDSSFYNKDNDYWFNAEKVFYRFDHDTLIVISGSISKKPITSFFSKFKVKCVQIKDNIEYIMFMKDYKKQGFKDFPDFPRIQ